jgi:phosphonate transport system substrate-binding protein
MFLRPILFTTALVCCTGANSHAAGGYSFGVVPQQSASRLAELWIPLLDQISEAAGVRLNFATARNIPTFERKLAAGDYDFAYMNPYHYTVFGDSPGYRAIAKAKDRRIRGILVVRKDSPITDIRTLQQAELAFPSPAAFAASILTRAYLARESIAIKPRYVSSHDSVYRSVALGLYPAGGGIQRTLDNVDTKVRDQLRVLWTSPGYTPHAFAAHPRVAAELTQQVQRAMLKLDDSKAGMALLRDLNLPGLESARHEDWNDVRALDIHLLQNTPAEDSPNAEPNRPAPNGAEAAPR